MLQVLLDFRAELLKDDIDEEDNYVLDEAVRIEDFEEFTTDWLAGYKGTFTFKIADLSDWCAVPN